MLNEKVDKMNSTPSEAIRSGCEACGMMDHESFACPLFVQAPQEQQSEEISYVGGQQGYGNQGRQFNGGAFNKNLPPTHPSNWRSHPNFSYAQNDTNAAKDGANQGFQQRTFPSQKVWQPREQFPQAPTQQSSEYTSIGETLAKLLAQGEKREAKEDLILKEIEGLKGAVATLEIGHKMLEKQVAQQASSSTRSQGKLPAHPEANPKWEANFLEITEEDIKEFEKGNIWLDDDGSESPFIYDEEVKAMELKSGKIYNNPPLAPPKRNGKEPAREVESQVEVEETPRTRIEDLKEGEASKPPKKVPIPFPSRLKKKKDEDKGYQKFVEMMKGLYVTLPLAEILTHAPHYKRYLKEVATKKRSLEEPEEVVLNEDCSAILQQKIPPKLKDPGKFYLPCSIGNRLFEKAFCDLGASISLIPYSLCKSLNLGEPKPTRMTLTLADRSSRHPLGIIENVHVRIGKFLIPGDFVVMEMEEDVEIPILLGRPFLHTAGAIFDTYRGKIILNVLGEELEFNMNYKPKKAYEAMICVGSKYEATCVEHLCSINGDTSLVYESLENDKVGESIQVPSLKSSEGTLANIIKEQEGDTKKGSAKEKRKAWFLNMKRKAKERKSKMDKVEQAPSPKLSKRVLASMIDEEIDAPVKTTAKEKRKAWFKAMKKRVGLQKKADKMNGALIAKEPG